MLDKYSKDNICYEIENILFNCGSCEHEIGQLDGGTLTFSKSEISNVCSAIYDYIIKNLLYINRIGEKVYSIFYQPKDSYTLEYGIQETTLDLRGIDAIGIWAFFDEEQAKKRANELNAIEALKRKELRGGMICTNHLM